MKNYILLLIIAVCASCSTTSFTGPPCKVQCKAPELYEAYGPVKEIDYKMTIPGQYGMNVLKFKKDGRQRSRWTFHYGCDGRVSGNSIIMKGFEKVLEFQQDSLLQVPLIKYKYVNNDFPSIFIDNRYSIMYGEDGMPSLIHLIEYDKEGNIGTEADIHFSDYEFDDHGSWISRTMTLRPKVLPDTVEWVTTPLKQTRTITYFKERKNRHYGIRSYQQQ